jgi:preprotein translocase subunit Sec61beta
VSAVTEVFPYPFEGRFRFGFLFFSPITEVERVRIDPTLFVGASGTIATLLIAILSVLIGQVRWQARVQAQLEEQGRRLDGLGMKADKLEERLHAMEVSKR